jgi:quinol monooxygenase YgiN
VSYGYIASMKVKPGCRDDVVALLISNVERLLHLGCETYEVSISNTDDVTIWVFERWHSKADQDASLLNPEVRAAISSATPMLTGEFTSEEMTVIGGLGRR